MLLPNVAISFNRNYASPKPITSHTHVCTYSTIHTCTHNREMLKRVSLALLTLFLHFYDVIFVGLHELKWENAWVWLCKTNFTLISYPKLRSSMYLCMCITYVQYIHSIKPFKLDTQCCLKTPRLLVVRL